MSNTPNYNLYLTDDSSTRFSIFGFSPERIENFRERGKKDEIRCA